MAQANMIVSLFRAEAYNARYTSRLRCIVTPLHMLCATGGVAHTFTFVLLVLLLLLLLLLLFPLLLLLVKLLLSLVGGARAVFAQVNGTTLTFPLVYSVLLIFYI